MDPESKNSKTLRAKSTSHAEQRLEKVEDFIAPRAMMAKAHMVHPLGNSTEEWWMCLVRIPTPSSVAKTPKMTARVVAMLVAMQEWAHRGASARTTATRTW